MKRDISVYVYPHSLSPVVSHGFSYHERLNEDLGNGVVHIGPRKISHSRRLSLPTMNALGLIDGVMSDDSDMLMFGARMVIRR